MTAMTAMTVTTAMTALPAMTAVVAGVFGLLLGSFLNVCILAWGAEPKGSVTRKRSSCPRCGEQIAWYDNIPVISYLVLRGRCRKCRAPISVMYPLVELATGAIWAFFACRNGLSLEMLMGAVFFTLLLGIAVSDARAYIIPHEFTLGGTAIAIAIALISGGGHALATVLAALFGAGVLLLVGELGSFAFRKQAMGGGDMALMGMVGGFLGEQGVLGVIFGGAVVGIVLQLAVAVARPAAPVVVKDEGGARIGWPLLLAVVAIAVAIVISIVALARYGLLPEYIAALRWALVGAGAIFYAQILGEAPRWFAESRWAYASGIVSAAIAFALLPRPSVFRVGISMAMVSGIWLVLRGSNVTPAAPSEDATSYELREAGYVPFGISLSIAAVLLVLIQGFVGFSSVIAPYFAPLFE
jgi:leader peptidase (prepilin peptidase)/N-methyltransferase